MHTEIVRCLRIRHASLFDQPHRLKLELACKLPPFHDSPPVPSKHLTRCLRNQVQASLTTPFSVRRPRGIAASTGCELAQPSPPSEVPAQFQSPTRSTTRPRRTSAQTPRTS